MDQEQQIPVVDQPFTPGAGDSGKHSLIAILGLTLAFIVVIAGIVLFVTSGGFATLRNDMAEATVPQLLVPSETSPQVITPTEDAVTATLETQGTSDEISDIEADLNSTDLSSLNEIEQI